jgi:hypothetical protein
MKIQRWGEYEKTKGMLQVTHHYSFIGVQTLIHSLPKHESFPTLELVISYSTVHASYWIQGYPEGYHLWITAREGVPDQPKSDLEAVCESRSVRA